MRRLFRQVAVASCAAVVSTTLVLLPQPAQAAGTTYYVAGGATCSDANSGTTSGAPLCTLTAAARRAVAGDTVQVADGSYREQVNVPSGVAFRGSGRSVVLGSDAVPPEAWSPTSGNAWTASPGWAVAPAQVYVDSTLLTKAADLAGLAATNTWYWDASTVPASLLVNTGGGNPAQGHDVEATVRAYGFLVRAASGVTIDGFTARRQGNAGVGIDGGTAASEVRNTTVTQSASYGISDTGGSGNTIRDVHTTDNTSVGIRLSGTRGDLVSSSTTDHNRFHGVSVQGGWDNVVRGVTAYANLRPGTRVAAGVDVSNGSSGAVVEQNTVYGNDDSGIEIYSGSAGALVRDNLSYDNNDHGIDISKATDSTLVSNTVVGNNSSGINVEGGSTNTLVRDNMAVDNTAIPDRSKGDIRVDAASVTGTSLDRDLVFQTTATSTPIVEWNGITYTDFDAFRAASAQEAHGLAADPGFVALATRDLRLTGRSPAVDAADGTVPGWTPTDLLGESSVDDPKVADSGKGSPPYGDLGALEFTGAYALPPATRVASPDGLTIAVDASTSGTLGETVSSRTIDCGNGQAPLSGGSVRCAYSGSGSYTVTVRVTGKVVDGASWTDTASLPVGVQRDLPPTAALSVSPGEVVVGVPVTADASGSGDDRPGSTIDIDCGNGTSHSPGTASSRTCTYAVAGSHIVTLTVTDSSGQTATASRQVAVDAPPRAALTLTPNPVKQGEPLVANASGSTSGSAPITGYQIDCGNGSAPVSGADPSRVCTYDSTGSYTLTVTVSDALGNSGSASSDVVVVSAAAPTPALVVSPATIRQGEYAMLDGSGSTGTAASPIVGYRFDCGLGAATTWQSTARAKCTYTRVGKYMVSMVVRNTFGVEATSTATVTVTAGQPPTARLWLSRYRIRKGHAITAHAGGSTGSTVSPVSAYRFACGNGHGTSWQKRAWAPCWYGKSGSYTVKVWVRNTLGLTDTASRVVRVRR
jgi:parallel beta-helix repeat protein